MSTHPVPATRPGLSVGTLVFGIFLLVALLVVVAGFGVGTPELTIWVLMLVGWVTFWRSKRRR